MDLTLEEKVGKNAWKFLSRGFLIFLKGEYSKNLIFLKEFN